MYDGAERAALYIAFGSAPFWNVSIFWNVSLFCVMAYLRDGMFPNGV